MALNNLQAIIMGLLQGVTELFPVSSLGHSVILPKLLGWDIDQSDPSFLIFLVATHAATATVLFAFFFKDWMRILRGMARSLKQREISSEDRDAKLAWLLVVTTIPAGILGLLLEQSLKDLFAAAQLVAGVLILNGVLLGGAELLRRKRSEDNRPEGSDERIARLSWVQGLKIGLMQCLALIPGFSRTGATLTGGLIVGLSHEDAARFSFLLATPIIGAAAVLKLPELAGQAERADLTPTMLGAAAAAVGAYFSVRFLTRYFQTNKLWPFAIYCAGAGAVFSLVLLVR